MTDNDLDNDEFKKDAIDGGKKILKGMSKLGALFTKRVAEGMVNATIAQKMAEEPIDKVVAASGEIGKALVKGTVESTKESAPDIIEGATKIGRAINKKLQQDKDN